jgi:hypothetical protein
VASFLLARRILPVAGATLAVLTLLAVPGVLRYTTTVMTDIPALAVEMLCLAIDGGERPARHREGPCAALECPLERQREGQLTDQRHHGPTGQLDRPRLIPGLRGASVREVVVVGQRERTTREVDERGQHDAEADQPGRDPAVPERRRRRQRTVAQRYRSIPAIASERRPTSNRGRPMRPS